MPYSLRNKGLDGFCLKWIAMLGMTADHVGAVLFPQITAFRIVGRIAFPIFAFLLAEGFLHTGNVYRYMTRLGIFALISEIPYDLALHGGTVWYPQKQNIFVTLFLGICLLYLLERERDWILMATEALFVMWAAEFLRADYGFKGILLILGFYLARTRRRMVLLIGGAWNFLSQVRLQYYGVFAVPFLALYNGKRGRNMKYFFYMFYPVHLLALYMVSAAFR